MDKRETEAVSDVRCVAVRGRAAINPQLTLVRPLSPGDYLDQAALPGTVLPDETYDLASADAHVYARQRDHTRKALDYAPDIDDWLARVPALHGATM